MKLAPDLCSCFRKNADDSWSVIKSVRIEGPNGSVSLNPGMSFRRGVSFMGIDIVALLERDCGA